MKRFVGLFLLGLVLSAAAKGPSTQGPINCVKHPNWPVCRV
jgi:hypothetical protein